MKTRARRSPGRDLARMGPSTGTQSRSTCRCTELPSPPSGPSLSPTSSSRSPSLPLAAVDLLLQLVDVTLGLRVGESWQAQHHASADGVAAIEDELSGLDMVCHGESLVPFHLDPDGESWRADMLERSRGCRKHKPLVLGAASLMLPGGRCGKLTEQGEESCKNFLLTEAAGRGQWFHLTGKNKKRVHYWSDQECCLT